MTNLLMTLALGVVGGLIVWKLGHRTANFIVDLGYWVSHRVSASAQAMDAGLVTYRTSKTDLENDCRPMYKGLEKV
jgi:hypothetical protein